MTELLSPAQTRVLMATCRVILRDGRATICTVASEAGIASSTAQYHLRKLAERGLVTKPADMAGAIAVPLAFRCA